MGWLRVSPGGLAPSVGQGSCHCAAHLGGQASEVAARPSHWQHTKRALKGGTSGLGTRDVRDYRRPVGCLEAVITGAGTGWGDLFIGHAWHRGIAPYRVGLRAPTPLMDFVRKADSRSCGEKIAGRDVKKNRPRGAVNPSVVGRDEEATDSAVLVVGRHLIGGDSFSRRALGRCPRPKFRTARFYRLLRIPADDWDVQ